ncbi:hypothetical protein THRCLA_08372 [Thraustotheca clavata]|uniref:Uncharacterized protein n=1 Tax=Thraustotheca clavata TaxID=74557 RepID=A0A1V9Z6S8_9STRA|nr:hypothetical protein THRCLA_08372 [Thraustotheca clavata]
MLRHVHRHLKHVKARWMSSECSPYSWTVSDHVDRTLCCDEHLVPNDLLVMQEVITEEQEQRLADEAATMLRRRRYETDHWDQVIVNFKEMETSKWSPGMLIAIASSHQT